MSATTAVGNAPNPQKANFPLGKWAWHSALLCTPLVFFGHLLFGAELLSGYFDEVIALGFWASVPFWKWKPQHDWRLAFVLRVGVTAAAFGVFSTLFNGGLDNFPALPAAILTVFADTKVLAVGLGFAFLCFPRMKGKDGTAHEAALRALWVLAVLPLLNLPFVVVDLLSSGYSIRGAPLMARSGTFITQGVFPHKFLNAVSLSIGIIAACSLLYAGRKQPTLLILAALYSLALLTAQDVKSLMSVLAFGVTIAVIRPSRYRAAAVLMALFVAASAAVIAGPMVVDQADRFIIGEQGANVRTVVWPTAHKLASEHFPLGSGAGTFGSSASFTLGYSPVYYSTGLAQMHGAAPNSEDQFLLDFTWPKFLAEYGYLGAGLVGLLVLAIARLSFRAAASKASTPQTSAAYAFSWGMFCFLIVQSLGISILTVSYAMVPMGLGIAIAVTSERNRKTPNTNGCHD